MARELTSAEIEAGLKEMIYKSSRSATADRESPNPIDNLEFKRRALSSSEVEKEMGITTKNKGKKKKTKMQKITDQRSSDYTKKEQREVCEPVIKLDDGISTEPQAKLGKGERKTTRQNKYREEVGIYRSAKHEDETEIVPRISISPSQKSFSEAKREHQVLKLNSFSEDFPIAQHVEKQNYFDPKNSTVELKGHVIGEKKAGKKKKRKKKKKDGSEEHTSSESERETGPMVQTTTCTKESITHDSNVVKDVVEDSKSRALSARSMKLKEPSEEMLELLGKEMIFPLKKKSLRFPRANYFCRTCDYHCDEIPDCEKHMKDARHKSRNAAAEVETELKKIPPPSPQQIHALDRVIEGAYQDLGLSDEDLLYRKQLCDELESVLLQAVPGISVQLYGSSSTGFGLKDSGVDLDLVVPVSVSAPKALTTMYQFLKAADIYENVHSDFSAKIPSVNFVDRTSGLTCHITINSTLAYLSNQLLSVYSEIDERVRKLGVALRYWAKLCKVDRQTEGTMPSYCLAVMTVYYLQQCKTPVLPVITPPGTDDNEKTDGNSKKKAWTFNYDQFRAIGNQWESKNRMSVGALWLDMLKFYSLVHEYATDVISITQLELLKRVEKKWNNKRIAIEDPFFIKRNAARSISNSRVFEYLIDCFRKTYKYFGLPTRKQNFQVFTEVIQKEVVDQHVTLVTNDKRDESVLVVQEAEKITGALKTDRTIPEDGSELNIVDSEIIYEMSKDILSDLISQSVVTNGKTEEDSFSGQTTHSNDSVSCEENHYNHITCSSSLVGQLRLEPGETIDEQTNSSQCKSSDHMLSMHQSKSLSEDELHNNLTKDESGSSSILEEHKSSRPVSNTDILLSFSSPHTDNSDSLLPKSSVDQVLLTNGNNVYVQSKATDSEDEMVSSSAGSDNSFRMMDKLLQVLEEPLISNQAVYKTKSDTSTHLENQDLGLESLKLTNEHGKPIEVNISISENKMPSLVNDSNEGILDDAEENFSEDDAFHRSDEEEIRDKQNEGDFCYVFSVENFANEKGPAVICGICDKEGHLKHACPEEKLPELSKLPPMSSKHLQLLGQTLKNVPRDFAPTTEDLKMRERTRRDLEKYIQELFPDTKLTLFGSSCNGFGFRQSDLDFCLTFNREREITSSIEVIEALSQKLKLHRGLYNVFPITSAKVPIVKFKHRQSQLEGDISLSNLLAQHNTRLLFTYSCIDPRVRILGYAIKVFAKVCDIGDASKGSLSSYAYILMLLHYLQNCNPPVVPVLQELHSKDMKPEKIVEGVNAWFYDDVQGLPFMWSACGKNRQSVAELWIGLFRYYTESFNLKDYVVCIRQLEPLTKFEKLWNGTCLAIEDPFDLGHNLGAGLSRRMNNFIQKALINGRQIYGMAVQAIPPNFLSPEDYFFDCEQLTEGKPPTDRCCHVCSKIGHIAKECPVVTARKMREGKEKQRKREITGRERYCNADQMQGIENRSSPRQSVSLSNDQERYGQKQIRGQMIVNSTTRAMSDPSGRSQKPTSGHRGQRNFPGSQIIQPPMSQLPKPMMPNQQSPTRQMNFHSKQTRNYHGSMPNTFPMSRPLLHTPISTGSIPHPLHQVSQSSRTMHAAVSPILTQQPFHKAEQFLYHQMTPPQNRDGPPTQSRHFYSTGVHGAPVVVASNEFYRGNPQKQSSTRPRE